MMDFSDDEVKTLLDHAIDPALQSVDVLPRVLAAGKPRTRGNNRRIWLAAGVLSGLTAATLAVVMSLATTSSTAIEPAAASDSCPTSTPQFTASDGSASTSTEPLDADKLVVCGYSPFGEGGAALVAQVTVSDSGTIAQLRNGINELKVAPKNMHCPFDNGAAVLAVFIRDGKQVRVLQSVNGCHLVSTKTKQVLGLGSTVRDSLLALLPQSYRAEVAQNTPTTP